MTDILPTGVYEIKNMPMHGTILELRDNVDSSVPDKIYGRIPEMVKKTFRAFLRRGRSTGVLLSGERGMGKSMFAVTEFCTIMHNVHRSCSTKALMGFFTAFFQRVLYLPLGKTLWQEHAVAAISCIKQLPP